MKKLVMIMTAVAVGLVGSVVALPGAAVAAVGSIAWSPCPDNDPVMEN